MDRKSFVWKLGDYEDLPTTTWSPLIEHNGLKFKLKVYPHDTSQLWFVVEELPDNGPCRINTSCKMTPSSLGVKSHNLTVYAIGSAFKFDTPPVKHVSDNGNTLSIKMSVQVVPRESEETVGVILALGKRGREDEETEDGENKRAKNLDEESDMPICKICFINTNDTVFLPCRHMGCCVECAVNLQYKRCPFCNNKFKEFLRVFPM